MNELHPPRYPITEHESWKVLVCDFESGAEQVVQRGCYENREWDLSYVVKSGDYVRKFIHDHVQSNRVFMWKELDKTSRTHVKLGHGNYSRTTWLLPLIEANSVTIYVNSIDIGGGTGVGSSWLISGLGTASLGIVSLPAAPNYSDVITFSYMDSYYCPMVMIRDMFQFQLQAPVGYGEIMFTLKEMKQDYPAA